MKPVALIVASFFALAPIHAYAGTQDPSSDQKPIQLAWDEDYGNTCGNGILNILNCNNVDVNVL